MTPPPTTTTHPPTPPLDGRPSSNKRAPGPPEHGRVVLVRSSCACGGRPHACIQGETGSAGPAPPAATRQSSADCLHAQRRWRRRKRTGSPRSPIPGHRSLAVQWRGCRPPPAVGTAAPPRARSPRRPPPRACRTLERGYRNLGPLVDGRGGVHISRCQLAIGGLAPTVLDVAAISPWSVFSAAT